MSIKANLTAFVCLILSLGVYAQQQKVFIEFFPAAGFYSDSIVVELSQPGAAIYYTLDGSTPSLKSKKYTKPIQIKRSTVIRAMSFIHGKRSDINAQTYFINEPASTLMVVSVAIPPGILFNKKYGLFMTGTNVDSSNWKLPTANFWSRTETLCNIECFETDGNQVINQLSGFRIFGGMSRLFPQKSFAVAAREKYGVKKFDYPFFGKKAPEKFKFLVFRNSGSDWGKSHFRDALMTSLVSKWDMDVQAYRPAHVYINGKYWGIYNIREKINRHFLSSHHGLHKDSVNLMEHKFDLKFGNARSYYKMMRFIQTADFRNDKNMAILNRMMDVDNFMNYQIAQIYFDNQDAGGNIRYWKPKQHNGRWKWILFDTDFGFGLHNPDAYRMNTLAIHTDPNSKGWPNPPWSTLILRKLLANKSFKQAFLTRFCDHLNDSFAPTRVEKKIDKFYTTLLPEMPRHTNRWQLDFNTWTEQVDIMRLFARQRPLFMRVFLRDMFSPGRECLIHLDVDKGGSIVINNTIETDTSAFDGIYFSSLPVTLRAKADFGYLFDHWEGPGLYSTKDSITVQLSEPVTNYRAVFKPFENKFKDKLVINEISNANPRSGDWIELYNSSLQDINIGGWVFRDSKHEFTLPSYVLKSGNYLVVCQDLLKFRRVFKHITNVIGSFNFGLSKTKESIELYSTDKSMVDKVYYELTPGDSLTTMALIMPQLDNSGTDYWKSLIGIGSPGELNPFVLNSSVEPADQKWIKMGAWAGLILVLLLGTFWWLSIRKQ
ncbi:MAG TPA: CotH kinase family protein [Saprospiraceae bacterium]|nr:CotH kinase family protein [Saprospiraceae bacterium]MCC6689508.1 CotH kinase family protein [Saprospiraceae bacterium]HMV23099.1 CotH kinase family protein [Saprospiraceae bacterium]HMW74607.1 CotH kinase family protein [Saprospiraceae bacterium]HMX82271.1 CotH kinase family protein [Saprospiraceae bacterium]